MKCKQFVDFLMDYLDGELPEAVRKEFERHIGDCPPCVEYLESYKTTVELGRKACTCDDAVPEDIPEPLVRAILAAIPKKD